MSPAPRAIEAPGAVRWICRTLEEAGFETWAVGGAVRDALSGVPSGDWDLTTRARPREVRRIFRRTVPVGIDHGTVGVLARDGTMYEVTTFRRDVETTGRHAVVAFADSLDEDLARRDFTINAVAWHPLTGAFHDPFGGAGDLDARLLRTVGAPAERFAEDWLRVLRALRFAGAFHLRVEAATWEAVCAGVPHLGRLSPERVREELEKVMTGRGLPSASLALYAASGVLGFLHPELDAPPARSRLAEVLRTVDLLPAGDPELRVAALLSAAGSTGAAVAVLARLRSSNRRIDRGGAVAGAVARVRARQGGIVGLAAEPLERRRWMVALGRELVPPALQVLRAGARARGAVDPEGGVRLLRAEEEAIARIEADLRAPIPLAPGELAISGRDLIRAGHRPGPAFGTVLSRLLDEVLADPSLNASVPLLRRAETLMNEAPADDRPASPEEGA
jgi:tRNA nucleotidyltransferase (CCA-adding enzyme)